MCCHTWRVTPIHLHLSHPFQPKSAMEVFKFVLPFSHSCLPSIVSYMVSNFLSSSYAFLPSKSRADTNQIFTALKEEVQNLQIQLKISHYCLWIQLVTQMSKIAISDQDESALSSFLKRNCSPERKDRTSRLWGDTHIHECITAKPPPWLLAELETWEYAGSSEYSIIATKEVTIKG